MYSLLRPSHTLANCSAVSAVGRWATAAPFNAPGETLITRSGVMPASKRARSCPACIAPSDPPPDSTKAVVGWTNAVALVRCRCHRIVPPLHGPFIGGRPNDLSPADPFGPNDPLWSATCPSGCHLALHATRPRPDGATTGGGRCRCRGSRVHD